MVNKWKGWSRKMKKEVKRNRLVFWRFTCFWIMQFGKVFTVL